MDRKITSCNNEIIRNDLFLFVINKKRIISGKTQIYLLIYYDLDFQSFESY